MPPASCAIPALVTVHDLIHLHFYSAAHVAYYDWVLKRLYRRCAAIVCVSEFTRNEFLEWSGIPGDRVFTVYNGVSAAFRETAHARLFPFPYILYPGNRRAYKNLDRLLQAYAMSSLPRSGIHLVLTGEADSHLQREATACGIDSGLLRFAGHVSDADLVALYQGAVAVAFVSLYEGFGLPIIEAMAAGAPVLASNTSSMPEVGGDAALLVNPYSVTEIAEGLDRLALDEQERQTRVSLGRQRAGLFSWDQAASRLWGIVAGM